MKLVALVKTPAGRFEVLQFPVNGHILWNGCVKGAITQDEPTSKDIEVNQGSATVNYKRVRFDLEDRLEGADKDGITISRLSFGYQEPDEEIAPTGEIFLFCDAEYRGSVFTVTAKSHLGRDFIVNYLEKLVWERLLKKKIKADAAQN